MTGIKAVLFHVSDPDEGSSYCVGTITYSTGSTAQTPIETYTELREKVVSAGLTMPDLKISPTTITWLKDRERPEDRRRVQMVIVTDQPNSAYGGVQLPTEMLHEVERAIRSGSLPLTFNHDSRYVTKVSYRDSGVRERPDGFHEVWADADIPAADWDRFDQQRKEMGAPGGISLTFSLPVTKFAGPSETPVAFVLAADAHHFSDDEIRNAGSILSQVGDVECERMFQFSIIPPAAVVITFLLEQAAAVPPGVLASYLWESVKGFYRKDKDPTSLTLQLDEEPGKRKLTAVIPATTDPAVAQAALATFEQVANHAGIYEYRSDEEAWTVVRPQG